MTNPTITGDPSSSNINIDNSNLIVSGIISAMEYTGDGGLLSNISGGSSNLQDVSDTGNVTSNTIILSGGLVTGNVSTTLTPSGGALTLDMESKSYKTFTCSTSADITTLNISNDIMGSQGIIYVNAGAAITLNGITSTLGGTNIFTSYDDISVGAGSNAVITFTSDGTTRYVNAGKYPGTITTSTSSGGTSNLQDVSDTGNVTSNTIILSGGLVTGNVSTTLTPSGGALTLDMESKSYKTFTCSASSNITTINISNDIMGSQGIIYVNASSNINLNGITSTLGGTNIFTSYDDISINTNSNAVITFTSDGTNRYVNAGNFPGTISAISSSGIARLQAVSDTGNVTSNTLILSGGLVTGNNATALTPSGGALTLDMESKSYKTFTCSASSNITTLNISNDIMGAQGIIYITASSDMNLNGTLGGANVLTSYDDISIEANNNAVIFFTSDGTTRYVNAGKYPGEVELDVSSNLHSITSNGSTTTNTISTTSNVDAGNSYVSGTITAGAFSGNGSGLTNVPSNAVQECFDVHPTGGQNVTSLTQVILNSVRYNSNNSVFSLNTSTGLLTVNKTAVFMINFTMSTGISSSTQGRSISKANLYINDALQVYTSVYIYNRMNTREEGTGSNSMIVQLTSGDTVAIKCFRLQGTDTISSVSGGTGLRLVELLS
jgi:hypothetical protein